MVLNNVCTCNFRQNIRKLIRTRQDQKFWYPLLRNFRVLLAKFYFLKIDWRLTNSLPKDFLNISWQFVYKVFYTSYRVPLYMWRIKPSLNTAKFKNIVRVWIKHITIVKCNLFFQCRHAKEISCYYFTWCTTRKNTCIHLNCWDHVCKMNECFIQYQCSSRIKTIEFVCIVNQL